MDKQNRVTNTSALRLENVGYQYQYNFSPEVLKNISLNINEGERIVFLGANGTGKSTLLKILAGLYFATSGQTFIFNELITEQILNDSTKNYALRKKIGYLFQDSDVQLFSTTVEEEIAFGPLHLGFSEHEIKNRVNECLAYFNIDHLRIRNPHRLSGGEKRKVAMASIYAYNPILWIFDEPTIHLDPKSQDQWLSFYQKLSHEKKTLITATHDLSLLKLIADTVYIFDDNHKIIFNGTPDDVFTNKDLLKKYNLVSSNF